MEFSKRIQDWRALRKPTEIYNSWVPEALGNNKSNCKRGFEAFVSYASSGTKGGDFVTASG